MSYLSKKVAYTYTALLGITRQKEVKAKLILLAQEIYLCVVEIIYPVSGSPILSTAKKKKEEEGESQMAGGGPPVQMIPPSPSVLHRPLFLFKTSLPARALAGHTTSSRLKTKKRPPGTSATTTMARHAPLLFTVVVAVLAASAYARAADQELIVGGDDDVFGLGGMIGRRRLDDLNGTSAPSPDANAPSAGNGTTRGYISYLALSRGSAPCSLRGASYYNCRPGAEANPYSRGCSAITQCRG